jgi:hypothetical protein
VLRHDGSTYASIHIACVDALETARNGVEHGCIKTALPACVVKSQIEATSRRGQHSQIVDVVLRFTTEHKEVIYDWTNVTREDKQRHQGLDVTGHVTSRCSNLASLGQAKTSLFI